MPDWIYIIPFLWFVTSGLIKFAKSGGQKIVLLGDFVIALGFLYQLVFPKGIIGFYIAGAGVVIDFILYLTALKNTKRMQREKSEKKD